MILFIMYLIGLFSICFLSFSVLSVLISLEFLIFILFSLILINFYCNNILELIMFLVFSVGESLLGLILMILKVSYEGQDFLSECF